jgi:hypothetical protein
MDDCENLQPNVAEAASPCPVRYSEPLKEVVHEGKNGKYVRGTKGIGHVNSLRGGIHVLVTDLACPGTLHRLHGAVPGQERCAQSQMPVWQGSGPTKCHYARTTDKHWR